MSTHKTSLLLPCSDGSGIPMSVLRPAVCCPLETWSGWMNGCLCLWLKRKFLCSACSQRSSQLNFKQLDAAKMNSGTISVAEGEIKCVIIHPSISLSNSLCDPSFLSPLRTTESTSSWDSSGTTLGWPTASTPTTRWTSTPLCWTPSGNLTCSLPTRKGPTSTRSPPTTSCCAFRKTATCCTAYGEWRKCEAFRLCSYCSMNTC